MRLPAFLTNHRAPFMTEIFIGRQPIFNQQMQIFAYELLFRGNASTDTANVIDGDSATSQVMINALVDIGLNNIVGPHPAFINLTRMFVTNPDLVILPPGDTVLEILEDIEPNEQIVNALNVLKQQGHTIALDDFVYDHKFHEFIDLADIIKIDVMTLDNETVETHAKQLKTLGKKLLAEKVETYVEFEWLKGLGFDYYQGYFFARPALISGKTITANQINLLMLIAEINNPEVEIEQLSKIIGSDVSLSHKLLKFINSPISGLRTEVDSIKQAVVLLGMTTIRNWATVMALANGSGKPIELSKSALVRGRCCELLATAARLPKPESCFTVGLFSTLDAMLDQPLDILLSELPLAQSAKLALLRGDGEFGQALGCTLAMERNEESMQGYYNLSVAELGGIYLQALQWADEMTLHL